MPFGSFATAFPALWINGARALGVAIVVEILAFILSLAVGRRVAAALARGGGLDATFRLRRRRKVQRFAHTSLRVCLWSVGLVIVLSIFGIDTRAVLLLLGLLGLAVVLAARPVLTDIATGMWLLAEDAVAPGDTVTVGTVTGRVEDIGLRAMLIRDESGGMHLISHSACQTLTNHTRVPGATPRS